MTSKTFFPNLDGLRFIAFFLVFWQHISAGLFQALRNDGILDDSHARFFVTGGLGVSFFFVLSGFLITYLLLQEKLENGKISLRGFYARRILRIFPLYYLVVVFGFVLYPGCRVLFGLPTMDIGNSLLYATFLGNFDMIAAADRPGFIGVLWSLSIEEQFYLVWAVLVAFVPRGLLKYMFLVIVAVSTVFRFQHAGDDKVLYFHTLSVMSDLAVGAGMAFLAWRYSWFKIRFEGLNRFSILGIYFAGFTLIWFYPSLFQIDQMAWLQRLLFAVFFAFVIAEQNYAINSLVKLGNFKLISKLGILTYGLYLLHMIALFFVETLLGRISRFFSDYTNFVFLGIAGMAGSILLAYLSFEYFETRFLRLKKRFVAKPHFSENRG